MELALIYEKAITELKFKRKFDYKKKNNLFMADFSKSIGKRLMNKVYDYLTSINDEALPRMFISNHE